MQSFALQAPQRSWPPPQTHAHEATGAHARDLPPCPDVEPPDWAQQCAPHCTHDLRAIPILCIADPRLMPGRPSS